MTHNLEPGAVLYSSGGYDQTNVYFYKVVRRTAHTVDLVSLRKHTILDQGPYTEVIPDPDVFFGDVIKGKRVGKYGIKINSFMRAHPWDGKPKYQTGFGFGH